MGKINVLDSGVFNMLAAGEVVERPASVVKELVENSLDAGATRIDIAIEEGGIRKIQVSDNGVGIQKDDLRNAFLPHATSKIAKIEDLDCLATLGFRGEALASIASVSEVTLISASKTEGKASRISLKGGEVVFEAQDSRSEGTIITVENLFFNTPARLKFLKKAANEGRAVADAVRTLILANPSVAFTFSNEDGIEIEHEGGTLQDAICSVYGAKTADNLLPVKENNSYGIKVSGYVSKADHTKPSRAYQTIIVNGRTVEDTTVQTAAEKAYGDYLMKRAYPMFALDIVMPFDEVDANVHPRKTEVRFADKQKVFGAVYRAVQNTIEANVSQTRFGFNVKPASDACDKQPPENNISSSKRYEERAKQEDLRVFNPKIDISGLFPQKSAPRDFGFPSSDRSKSSSLRESAVGAVFVNDDIRDKNTADDEDRGLSVFDGKIVGQVFATYILAERDEKLYIIDQHAAHERILYDKIVNKISAEYSQPLLAPYELSLTGVEEEYLENVMPKLVELGFVISAVNGKYFVNAVPEPAVGINFSKFFGDLFADTANSDALTLAGLLKDSLCQQACKAAIKGGDMLSLQQIERVIKSYVDDNGELPAKCPHGRPTVIALEKRDFEKMFKRIV